MTEYEAIAAYMGVTLIVFVAALLWNHYRVWLKRRLNIEDYQRHTPEKDHHGTTAPGHSA